MTTQSQPLAAAGETAPQVAGGSPGEPAPAAAGGETWPLRLGPGAGPHPVPPATGESMPSQLGPYRILRLLGRGGMGAVYLAEDVGLGRRTALKVMLPELAAEAKSRERFLREARAAAAVRNDHVVTVYRVDEADGMPYIAMELLRGVTLQTYLEKCPPPRVPAVLRLAREAAEGLAAAHERGLVHRDIKPANIWLEAPKGRVKILDFGLARRTESYPDGPSQLTQTGIVIGTPAYMSPEQARGSPLDFRTDLFSLGSVLYQTCAGRLPFGGPTPTAVLAALVADRQTPARESNPQVPAALSELIDRLLEKDPAARPGSAREVIAALRAIERGEAATAPVECPFEIIEDDTQVEPPPTRKRTGRRRRVERSTSRGIWWAAFAGVALAAAVVGGLITAWLARPTVGSAPIVTPATPGEPAPRPADVSPRAAEPPPQPTFAPPFEPPPKGPPPKGPPPKGPPPKTPFPGFPPRGRGGEFPGP